MCGGAFGPEGMFSMPMARWRIPQIQRAPHRESRHQTLMKRNRGCGGSQNIANTSTA